jgi:hypothetical protein
VLPTIAALFERLEACGVQYCHWKSNWVLEETLDAQTDVDLLVRRQDAPAFRAVLEKLGFRPAIEVGLPPFPSVEHHLALDEAERAIVHVHAYYRVISGDSLTKNYHLPLEEMLLADARRDGAVRIPPKGAELVVFVLRMSLKHATLAELSLLLRSWDDVRREAAWLATDEARSEASSLLPVWLPGFGADLFARALDALLAPAPLWRRVILARRVRAKLRPFARRGRVGSWSAGVRAFASRAVYHVRGSRKRLTPGGGGAVIAFVGPEATGKSTMLAETESWLGRYFTVRRVHAGKPSSTLLTVLPNVFLPALRSLLPAQRSTRVVERRLSSDGPDGPRGAFPLLFGIRSMLLAHDRKVLLTRAFAEAANGTIVLCDRYPSAEGRGPDGPQLGPCGQAGNGGRIRRWLVEREAHLYQMIPPPDLVIYLTASLDTTLARNKQREKVEPDDYLRSRHSRSSQLEFERAPVRTIDADRPLDELVAEIRQVVWATL